MAPLQDGRLQLPTLLQRYTLIVAICAVLLPYCELVRPEDQRLPPEDRTVKKAIFYIHNRYVKPLTLRQIARYVHLHPNYLCAVFKAYTGHTVMEHLSQTRVDAAKFLLRREAMSMARIVELSGFSGDRAFFRQFKQITGITQNLSKAASCQ